MTKPDFSKMNGPQLAEAYNAMAKIAGLDPVKRFSNTAVGLRRCLDLAAKASPTKTKVTEKKTDGRSSKFGADISIKIVAKENPRSKGTKAAAKWNSMTAFMAKNKNAKLSEVIAETNYQRRDYEWDLAKGHVK